tara:strand:- start:200 stop:376 length:177 start_codon:yes stop_codon:yes gene_type:complete
VGSEALPGAAVAMSKIGNQRSVFKERKVSLAFFGSFLSNAKKNIENIFYAIPFNINLL